MTAPGSPPAPSTPVDFDFHLPAFPVTASQLVSELNRENVQVARVTQLIECDPIISSKVLSLANSPIYCPARPITTINHAIVILGFKSVAKLVLTVATGSVFSDSSSPCSDARKRTYRQSLAVGTIARRIAECFGDANADEAFLVGVMHDVGKLVLFKAVGEDYAAIVEVHPLGDTTDIENERWGANHPELGKSCGMKWGLPHEIGHAISRHHLPLEQVDDPLSRTLIAADYFARRWAIGFQPQVDFPINEALESELAESDDATVQEECSEQFAAIQEICAA